MKFTWRYSHLTHYWYYENSQHGVGTIFPTDDGMYTTSRTAGERFNRLADAKRAVELAVKRSMKKRSRTP